LIETGAEIPPGQVVDVNEEEIVIALQGGALKVGRIKADKGQKLNAGEFAREMDLKVGMRFGA
jgi:methionyl-tRNA formyltransferase